MEKAALEKHEMVKSVHGVTTRPYDLFYIGGIYLDVQNRQDIFGLKMDTGQIYSRSMAVLVGKSCIRKA